MPILGLLMPPALYLLFFGTNSSAFSAVGLSANNMLVTVALASAIILVFTAALARSTNKFFKKNGIGDFKKAFGANSLSESLSINI